MIVATHHRFQVAGITDTGRQRELNEDSLMVDKDIGLLLVADGMGGHEAGEVASAMAVNSIRDFLSGQRGAEDLVPEVDLSRTIPSVNIGNRVDSHLGKVLDAINDANYRIYASNRQKKIPDGKGMGTAIAGLWFWSNDAKGAIFHVGDCRIYQFRDGKLGLRTRDHTLYQQWQDLGSKGQPPEKNIILRALGPRNTVQPEVDLFSFKPKDKILICSDGLTAMLSDSQIEQVLIHTDDQSLEVTANYLIALANQFGGDDNITVIIAQILA